MNFIRGLFRLGRTKIHVGTDHFGNKYFELPEKTTSLASQGGLMKARRMMESPYSHVEYEEGMIPHEWEAWVRGKRRDPPTQEEIAKREQRTLLVKKRAKELEEKDEERQLLDYKEGLVAKPAQTKQIGHASAPVYDKVDSVDSVSTGRDFEPSAWQPGKSTAKVK